MPVDVQISWVQGVRQENDTTVYLVCAFRQRETAIRKKEHGKLQPSVQGSFRTDMIAHRSEFPTDMSQRHDDDCAA